MTYQKTMLRFIAIAMVSTMGMFLSACGDDKDDVDKGKESFTEVIGTWGLVLKEIKVPNENGGTNQVTTSYDYLNPSKEDELVISLTPADQGDPHYTIRQYYYDYEDGIWRIITMGDAFVTKEALILRHNDKSEQVSYEWTINSNKLVLETKDISTDSYLRYTFKKVSSEVKESETLNIIK